MNMKRYISRKVLILWIVGIAGLGGCGDRNDLYSRIQSEDPAVRIEAIAEAGQKRDAQAMTYLVDRLEDPNSEVRFYSILSLDQITGQRLGYEYYAPVLQREQAVLRWREWLKRDHPQADNTR